MHIVDQVLSLDRHPHRSWTNRPLSVIDKIILHQSMTASDTKALNQYHISSNHICLQGCPRICYHFAIESDGKIVQCNDVSDIVWHTKGENTTSIGIVVLGNFNGLNYRGGQQPSSQQLLALGELIQYLCREYRISLQKVFGHHDFREGPCPGYYLQEWITFLKSGQITDLVNNEDPKLMITLQKALSSLGYYHGRIDGLWSPECRKAVLQFQVDNQLLPDGLMGEVSWKKIKNCLAVASFKPQAKGA
ncbi:N-acetylmuramoyl-L-alanine amidase [Persicobacter diffluens]|uniref:N-acetylmuramoyl-L-alanine amidase n=1 Tax=Persicobacter diffluens TaxID=981 RepID=A0AAN4VYI9_9BACT|nr:hypothetical protein PEDI_16790 [Persicobacter diffluens]